MSRYLDGIATTLASAALTAIAAALAVAWALSHLHEWPPWLLAPLCATGAYLALTSISEARDLE